MTDERIIRIEGCKDCPYCMTWFEATPGVYTLTCEKVKRTDQVVGWHIPSWCPLDVPDSKRNGKGGSFALPMFLSRRQGE